MVMTHIFGGLKTFILFMGFFGGPKGSRDYLPTLAQKWPHEQGKCGSIYQSHVAYWYGKKTRAMLSGGYTHLEKKTRSHTAKLEPAMHFEIKVHTSKLFLKILLPQARLQKSQIRFRKGFLWNWVWYVVFFSLLGTPGDFFSEVFFHPKNLRPSTERMENPINPGWPQSWIHRYTWISNITQQCVDSISLPNG